MKLSKNHKWYNSLKSECFKCNLSKTTFHLMHHYSLCFLSTTILQPHYQLLITLTGQPHPPNNNQWALFFNF